MNKPYSKTLAKRFRPKARKAGESFLTQNGWSVRKGTRFQPDLIGIRYQQDPQRWFDCSIKTSFLELFMYRTLNVRASTVFKFSPLTVLVFNEKTTRLIVLKSEDFKKEVVQKNNRLMRNEDFVEVPMKYATQYRRENTKDKWVEDILVNKYYSEVLK